MFGCGFTLGPGTLVTHTDKTIDSRYTTYIMIDNASPYLRWTAFLFRFCHSLLLYSSFNSTCNSISVNIKNDTGRDLEYDFEVQLDSFRIHVLLLLVLLLLSFSFCLSFWFFFFSFFLASDLAFALALALALSSLVLMGLPPDQYLLLLLSFLASLPHRRWLVY